MVIKLYILTCCVHFLIQAEKFKGQKLERRLGWKSLMEQHQHMNGSNLWEILQKGYKSAIPEKANMRGSDGGKLSRID